MKLSDQLRSLRRSREWSQRSLRTHLVRRGITVTCGAISAWEARGVTPPADALRELARIYRLSPSEEFDLYRMAADSAAANRSPTHVLPEPAPEVQLALTANEPTPSAT